MSLVKRWTKGLRGCKIRIFLNGNQYELKAGTGVQRSPLAEWADNIRLDGQQKRKDRRWLSTWNIDDWSNGLGIEWANLDLASQQARLWNVDNCDTRNPSQIVLSPLFNICTIVPSRGDLEVYFTHLGQLYFPQTLGIDTVAFIFSAPLTLGSLNRLTSTGTMGSLCAAKDMGANIAFISDRGAALADSEHIFRISGVGSAATSVGTLAIRPSTVIKPRLGDMGGTLHTIMYHASTLRFYLSGQDLGTLSLVGSIPATMGSYLAPLVTDGLTMFTYEPRGVYDFDETPSVIVDTARAQDLNGALAIWGQDLIFKNKTSLMRRSQDGSALTPIGYDRDDGLPPDKMGETTALCPSWKYLFAAVKGASYSHILAMDINTKWHYFARIPTMGWWVSEMFLSDLPDAIDRLWCLFGNAPNPGYFLNPMVNPLQAGTYAYVPTGFFDPPMYDGGMPETPGGFYTLTHISDGIVGSLRITSLYGLNGANPVSTLGVVATNTQMFTFGSPAGVEGYRIQPRFMLHSNTQGSTPIYRSAVLNYLKIPPIREAYEFTIDTEATAKARANPLEAVLGSLNSERNSRTLLPFWYGEIGTKNVRVIDAPVTEQLDPDIFEGQRKGYIPLRCVEMLG